MNAAVYTVRLRRVATVSWLAALAVALVLTRLGLLRLGAFLPFAALLVGAIPIALFAARVHATCAACGGHLRIAVGYPRMIYRCRSCGAQERTGIHADY